MDPEEDREFLAILDPGGGHRDVEVCAGEFVLGRRVEDVAFGFAEEVAYVDGDLGAAGAEGGAVDALGGVGRLQDWVVEAGRDGGVGDAAVVCEVGGGVAFEGGGEGGVVEAHGGIVHSSRGEIAEVVEDSMG